MSAYRCWLVGDHTEEQGWDVEAYDAWMAVKSVVRQLDNDSGSEISHGAFERNNKLRIGVRHPDGTVSEWDAWPDIEVRWYACVAKVSQSAPNA